VKTLIGYQDLENHSFFGEESAWSNTQTLLIDMSIQKINSPAPDSSNSTTAPASKPTDPTGDSISVPLSTLIAVVAVFLAVIAALSLLLYRHNRKTISQNKPNV
jgi:hypothetical protein